MEDDAACSLISHSVGNILRQSLDDNFKEECWRLLKATNTNMVEELLFKALIRTAQEGTCHSKQSVKPDEQATTMTNQQTSPLDGNITNDTAVSNLLEEVSGHTEQRCLNAIGISSLSLLEPDDEADLMWDDSPRKTRS